AGRFGGRAWHNEFEAQSDRIVRSGSDQSSRRCNHTWCDAIPRFARAGSPSPGRLLVPGQAEEQSAQTRMSNDRTIAPNGQAKGGRLLMRFLVENGNDKNGEDSSGKDDACPVIKLMGQRCARVYAQMLGQTYRHDVEKAESEEDIEGPFDCYRVTNR